MAAGAQPGLEALAEARGRVAHIARVFADGAAVFQLQIVLGQAQRLQPAANLGVVGLTPGAPALGGLHAGLLGGQRQNGAHGAQRQRHTVGAQPGDLRVAALGGLHAGIQLRVVPGALGGVFLQKGANVLRTGHLPSPPSP